MSVTVRVFAAAAQATGVDEVHVPPGELSEVLAEVRAIAADASRFDRVLDRCSVLVDGVLAAGAGEAATSTSAVAAGATVDVLPPFAGG
jgi:sulfur-carrier protein